ncbi:MAG: isoprenylcysteine carboxyl methyltransferase family protein [Planctomycetota bacterium]|jgi:methyltransferase
MVTSQVLFVGLAAATAIERLVEVSVSNRNARKSFARGGVEHGKGHYPFMVALHTGFLFAMVAEVLLLDRPFTAWIGYPALALAVLCQGLRWWCIRTLGEQWCTRVIVVPGAGRVTGGPYRFLRHPNYVVVVTEGLVLPLVHGAWITALCFTVLNAWLLTVRIRCEERALAALNAQPGA